MVLYYYTLLTEEEDRIPDRYRFTVFAAIDGYRLQGRSMLYVQRRVGSCETIRDPYHVR
jgi:hypothetical protein